MMRAALALLLALPLSAQTVERLPLPVDGPPEARAFESRGPAAAVLTGLMVPSSGPLTSWAPVFRTLEADGSLSREQTGAWNGPLPARWVKVARAGSVVAGMRVLVRTGPGSVQTRQLQMFWRTWNSGTPMGSIVEGAVFGQAAEAKDEVRIVELRVPDNAVAVGLYGQLLRDGVIQASLLVRAAPTASTADTVLADPTGGPATPVVEPRVTVPQAPSVVLPNAP